MACRRGALWEAAKKSETSVPLLLSWYDGTLVDVTLGNDNSLCLYVCGSFEPNEFSFLHGFLKPGMVFIDVGANDGYYTLFAARRVGQAGKVVAVEPSTRERINLRRNLVRNRIDNVHVVPAALERVTVKTIDMVAAELKLDRIDFVKIDVEGAEASVVAGARAVLTSARPVMLLEINDGALRAQGIGADALLVTLREEFDYETLVFAPSTGLLKLHVEGGLLSANVVVVPKERLSEFLDVA